jgi:uncharacterized protein (DUF1800 family)
LTLEAAAAIAANRFGLGARPGDLPGIGSDPRGWLRTQLRGGAPLLASDALPSTAQILAGVEPILAERRAARRLRPESTPDAAAAPGEAAATAAVAMRLPQYLRPIYISDSRARWRTAIDSDRPLAERLVHFWSNHFAVSVDKLAVLGIAGSFEREAIRPHVMGRFHELLLAVETHPAMLLYLDNQQSVGPNSQLARRAAGRGRAIGLNENLAREILELHTLGVDGGYTQADVTSFAKVLTGWSLGGGQERLARGATGTFVFRPNVHEPGAQTVLRKRYAEDDQAQGLAVLADLALAPATAHHIAVKLARHFIADDPPAAAVESIARAFEHSGGDLPVVYAALIDSPRAWDEPTAKFKTPQDYLFSLGRGLELPPESEPRLMSAFDLLGQRQFSPGSPAGWPDRSSDWDGASALMKRIELSDAVAQKLGDRRDAMQLAPQLLGGTLTEATRQSIARAASPAQALALLLTAPEFMRR